MRAAGALSEFQFAFGCRYLGMIGVVTVMIGLTGEVTVMSDVSYCDDSLAEGVRIPLPDNVAEKT